MTDKKISILTESKYRLMWMIVMFDLPVMTKPERRAATRFRLFLLNQGFGMSQFSVYFRFCGSKERTEKYVRKIQENIPETGNVSLLFFTDMQFGNTIHFQNRKNRKNPNKPDQLLLF